MDSNKNDEYFIQKNRTDLAFVVEHTRDIDQDELSGNEVLLDSMLFRLIQISENANKLSDDYKDKHKNIPWTAIYGLRNRIVHDYGNVDMEIVYSTLKEDIPGLLEMMDETVEDNY